MIQFIKTIAAAKRRQRRSCEDQFAVGDALAEELNVTAPPLASQGRISSANRDNLYKRLRECADQLDAADCAGYDEDSLASYLNTALKFPPETRDCTLPFSSYVAAKTPEQHKQAVAIIKESGFKPTRVNFRETLREMKVIERRPPPKGADPVDYAEQRQGRDSDPYAGAVGAGQLFRDFNFTEALIALGENAARVDAIIANHAKHLTPNKFDCLADELLELADKARALAQKYKQQGGSKKGHLNIVS